MAPPANSGTSTPKPEQPTLGERRAESDGQGDGALRIAIPAKPDELLKTVVPRMAGAPSINATAADPPVDFTLPAHKEPASSAPKGVSRAATVTRKSKPSSKAPVRRSSEAGYEGGVERHGQANDFVDEIGRASCRERVS